VTVSVHVGSSFQLYHLLLLLLSARTLTGVRWRVITMNMLLVICARTIGAAAAAAAAAAVVAASHANCPPTDD